MYSQPVLYQVPKRKQKPCKYGERLPNGKCPPKHKGVSNTSVLLKEDEEAEEEKEEEENEEPKTTPKQSVTTPPTASTKKQKPCKYGERLANGKCPPAPKTAKKSRVSPSSVVSSKYKNNVCKDEMTFEECELAILRQSVIENEKTIKKDTVMDDDSREMIQMLEDFLRRKKCICYGGTAINNILPEKDQFYNRDVEMPDYDFYSKSAKEDAKELADIYFLKGYREVEVKSGVHESTYKVFVNFIGVADVTHLDERIFDALQPKAIEKNGILYASPDFLRMSSYLELSRPRGDVSRWEKVFKRITLLNKYYPVNPIHDCDRLDFQRTMDQTYKDRSEEIFDLVKDVFVQEKVVFFGGYAFSVYADFFAGHRKRKVNPKVPDFDVLSTNPQDTAEKVAKKLASAGFKHIYIEKHQRIGDLIPESCQITVGTGKTSDQRDTLAFIYQPIACHSYNEITVDSQTVLVATINTILSFYLAFMFVNKWYYDKERILCMSQYLFDLEQANRLEQTGPLRRFSTQCYGKQKTLTDMFSIKNEIYKRIGKIRRTPAQQEEYDRFFFKYKPSQNSRHTAIVHTLRQNPAARATPAFVVEEADDDSDTSSQSSKEEEDTRHEVYRPPPPPPLTTRHPQPQSQGGPRPPTYRPNNNQTRKKKKPQNKGFFSRIF